MSDEAKRVRVVERPEKATIKAFVDSPGPFPKTSPSFLVVSGAQGTGKSTMLESLFAEYHNDGRWVLPVSQDIDPGSKLDLTDVVQQALRTQNLPPFLPSFQLVPTLLRIHQKPGRPFHRRPVRLVSDRDRSLRPKADVRLPPVQADCRAVRVPDR